MIKYHHHHSFQLQWNVSEKSIAIREQVTATIPILIALHIATTVPHAPSTLLVSLGCHR